MSQVKALVTAVFGLLFSGTPSADEMDKLQAHCASTHTHIKGVTAVDDGMGTRLYVTYDGDEREPEVFANELGPLVVHLGTPAEADQGDGRVSESDYGAGIWKVIA